MAKKIFCIIPAYNEENNIAAVIESVKSFIDEIIIVDDGSFDNTVRIAQKKSTAVIKHLINRGQGAALMTGNIYALENEADVIVHFDADGQFRAKDIPKIIKPILSGEAEAVFGSRFLSKKSNIPAFKRFIIMPLARAVNYIILGIKLSDPQAGFRAINSRIAAELNITNDGAAHCSEIMHKVSEITDKIREVPIVVNYNNFGQGIFSGRGRGSGGLRVLKDLIFQKIIS
ncbi:MAG: glycosyltransferase family 2 protein [Patescibacteria group bacterium]|nr:glycosyltransferase family 2 protein [Patescibacteria group bacterium]